MTSKNDGNIQEEPESAQPAESAASHDDAQTRLVKRKPVVVVAAIVSSGEDLLITRRRADVHLPNLWEFPGGKVEQGESLRAALRRELREELGIEAEVFDECFAATHHYSEKTVELHFFNCSITGGTPRAIDVAELRWVKRSELSAHEFPEADRELVEQLVRPHLSL